MPSTSAILTISLSLTPVVTFLVALLALDSYKLVRPRLLGAVVVAGALVAAACYFLNVQAATLLDLSPTALQRYAAPVIEEGSKALIVLALIGFNRVGFLVDAAILGFAVGAGFAVVENVYFLNALGSATVFTWIVRGFGTAIMHGGATAIFAVVTRALTDRYEKALFVPAPGLLVAIVFHSLYNHLVVPPIIQTVIVLMGLPILLALVFSQSEAFTRDWLGVGFDTDQELLDLIKTGNISDTRIGRYLQSLREHFAGEVIADMLCWLRLQVELSIKAKGVMLMREAGFKPAPDPATRAKLDELNYLEKSIGKTGLLAISPIVHGSRRDSWQIQLLQNN